MNVLHTDPASGLAYRLHPAAGAPRARLFLLHGVGGNETNLEALADTLDPSLELVFVRGPLTLGPAQFAWFQVRFAAQGPVIDPQQADHSRQLLHTLVQSLAAADATAIPALMAGFSQGGILSASVALTFPQAVSRFAILCGRILPEIAPHLATPEALANVQALIAHGRHDDKLPVAFAEHADAWLTRLGVAHTLRLYPVGHGLSADMADDFAAWIARQLPTA